VTGRTLSAATASAQLPGVVAALDDAARAAARLDPARSTARISELGELPFDLVSVTASLLIARRLQTRPAALLLGVQAEAAPAATPLTRAAGQLFLLAGEQFSRQAAPDAALSALQAMGREAGPAPVLTGAVWALALLLRLDGDDTTR
jgi:hypothetical protein